jgi:hypothetical protein
VGEPALILLQKATGASRPEEMRGSRWEPFSDDNGVSGHSFIGAIPFLSAASMTDRWYLRYPLIIASMLPAWARFHKDDHYFSQSLAGWWLAYRSVESVSGSLDPSLPFTATPILLPDGVAFALIFQL